MQPSPDVSVMESVWVTHRDRTVTYLQLLVHLLLIWFS